MEKGSNQQKWFFKVLKGENDTYMMEPCNDIFCVRSERHRNWVIDLPQQLGSDRVFLLRLEDLAENTTETLAPLCARLNANCTDLKTIEQHIKYKKVIKSPVHTTDETMCQHFTTRRQYETVLDRIDKELEARLGYHYLPWNDFQKWCTEQKHLRVELDALDALDAREENEKEKKNDDHTWLRTKLSAREEGRIELKPS